MCVEVKKGCDRYSSVLRTAAAAMCYVTLAEAVEYFTKKGSKVE